MRLAQWARGIARRVNFSGEWVGANARLGSGRIFLTSGIEMWCYRGALVRPPA